MVKEEREVGREGETKGVMMGEREKRGDFCAKGLKARLEGASADKVDKPWRDTTLIVKRGQLHCCGTN